MSPQLINDSAHWKRRAQEARRLAERLDDPRAKATMTEIAESYERLAEMAAKQQSAQRDGP